ncbi:MAG: hypothetical protein GC131_06420 [Alphaproteobacteria bacterium]|nr:hypothetical protein [Alphaproteobacteria bacterium]
MRDESDTKDDGLGGLTLTGFAMTDIAKLGADRTALVKAWCNGGVNVAKRGGQHIGYYPAAGLRLHLSASSVGTGYVIDRVSRMRRRAAAAVQPAI